MSRAGAGGAGFRRVLLVSNRRRADVGAALAELRRFLADRAELVEADWPDHLGAIGQARPDLVIVLGGDGTILGAARALGADQVPLAGVNLGKMGYLAEFSIEQLKRCFERIVADRSLLSERMMLEVWTQPAQGESFCSLAMNDCVIQAGPPFRMVQLCVLVDGERLTRVDGDGLIIATPTGSTAHNLSAGGPIVQAGVPAFCLTPICPHSLTHRPLIVAADHVIEVVAERVNAGTTVTIDGQVSAPVRQGDRVVARRFEQTFKLVRNPEQTRWHTLVSKLKWGQLPIES